MCRQFIFFHDECGHRIPTEVFPCPTNCGNVKGDVLLSDTYCAVCMFQESPPKKQKHKHQPLSYSEEARAGNVFDREFRHASNNRTGPQHINSDDLQAFKGPVSKVDLEYLREIEQQMDALIWAEFQRPPYVPPGYFRRPPSRDQRALVLQIRNAIERATVEHMLADETPVGQMTNHFLGGPYPNSLPSDAEILEMIKHILTPVSMADLGEHNAECIICYMPMGEANIVEKGAQVVEFPVQLPCNEKHIFGRICLENWFMTKTLNCPTCRADLRKLVAEAVQAAAVPQSPWWVTMLRGI